MTDKILIAQVAPSVRVALAEEFNLPAGTNSTKKIPTALKKLGFDYVFDTEFAADLTIMEEANELVERIQNKGVLPMFTSCCPAWVHYVEKYYPNLTPHLSTCKSPQQMMGAIIKTYFAKKLNLDPAQIEHYAVMPCMVKKDEARRPEMNSAYEYWQKQGRSFDTSFPDVDGVITTLELANLLKKDQIDLFSLEDSTFDDPLGASTGAATIFGVIGGVMEAALRTAYETVTKKPLEKIEFEQIRGIKPLKKATVDLNGLQLNAAIANGMMQAKNLLEEIKAGKSSYHFIEVMNCQGGCINGSGQPRNFASDVKQKRAQGLYDNDAKLSIRKSHENPSIIKLYEEFLTKPLSDLSHELLHTHYKHE